MKAILQFNLPEEQDEFEVAQNGWKYRRVVKDMDEHFRSIVKYGTDPFFGGDLSEAQWKFAADTFRGGLRTAAIERGIPLD